jgi:uncharacterized membrane protein YobD (UPF0266 family)
VIVRFVDIDGIDDHPCLNFTFIIINLHLLFTNTSKVNHCFFYVNIYILYINIHELTGSEQAVCFNRKYDWFQKSYL